MMMTRWMFRMCLGVAVLWACAASLRAEELVLGTGKVRLQAPEGWVSKEPKFKGIVSYEFVVKAVEGDTADGRVTIGGAGGGVEANIRRWISQYTQPDRSSTADRAVRKQLKIAGQTVHVIDIRGTYEGSQFVDEPRSPNFRLLGAIIATDKAGTYYVKFYGPEKTVAANEQAFHKMLQSLEVAD